MQLKDGAILGLGLGLAMRCQIWNYSYVLKLMAILGPNIVGLLDAIGPMPSRCTNSPPSSFQSTLSDIFTCLKANFFHFFLESCNPMAVLAIVCVAPAPPAATINAMGQAVGACGGPQ